MCSITKSNRFVSQMLIGMPTLFLSFFALGSMAVRGANSIRPGAADEAVLYYCIVPDSLIGFGIFLAFGMVGGLLIISAPRERE